ncbi:MAG: class I SAM-dependent methyltransferase [Bacteroidota bacterium]
MTDALLLEGLNYAEQNFLDDNADHLKVDKTLVRKLLDLDGKRIMDFGCGMGGMTLWYAKNWDCEVYGVDIDGHHIQVANQIKEKHNVQNVTFVKQNVIEKPLAGKFDFVFLNDVVEHIPLEILENIFQQLEKVLASKGKIFVSYPPWKSPYASHLNHVIKIPWCQFLPKATLDSLIAKHNHPIVGELESDLREAYDGLNHMTYQKLSAIVAKTNLKEVYRKSHCIINRMPLLEKVPFRFFPLDYLITKEFLMVGK